MFQQHPNFVDLLKFLFKSHLVNFWSRKNVIWRSSQLFWLSAVFTFFFFNLNCCMILYQIFRSLTPSKKQHEYAVAVVIAYYKYIHTHTHTLLALTCPDLGISKHQHHSSALVALFWRGIQVPICIFMRNRKLFTVIFPKILSSFFPLKIWDFACKKVDFFSLQGVVNKDISEELKSELEVCLQNLFRGSP